VRTLAAANPVLAGHFQIPSFANSSSPSRQAQANVFGLLELKSFWLAVFGTRCGNGNFKPCEMICLMYGRLTWLDESSTILRI
jgi:hypothetical protein